MKSQKVIVALSAAIIVIVLITGYNLRREPVADQTVCLAITGPDGQRFTGNYVANGITNLVSAVTPATISSQAKELHYEFQPDGSGQEFRVNLEVANVLRTSFVSYQGKSVRGGYSHTADSESVW